MSAHALVNLSNELGKIVKMRGLPGILSLFRNEFYKFNETRARMLDSSYHMTLKHTLKLRIFTRHVIKEISRKMEILDQHIFFMFVGVTVVNM